MKKSSLALVLLPTLALASCGKNAQEARLYCLENGEVKELSKLKLYFPRSSDIPYIDLGEFTPIFTTFDPDELYVIRECRSQGVGKMLFEAMEKEVGDQVDAITLATPTKDWHRILKFYIEEMGMAFYNAFLFKKTR